MERKLDIVHEDAFLVCGTRRVVLRRHPCSYLIPLEAFISGWLVVSN